MRLWRVRRGGNRRRAPRGDTALLGHDVASLTRRTRREARKPAARTRAVCCASRLLCAKGHSHHSRQIFRVEAISGKPSGGASCVRQICKTRRPPSELFRGGPGGAASLSRRATGYTAGRTARQDRGARFARSPTGSTPPSQSSPPRSRPHRPSATPKKHSPRIRRRYTLQAAVAFRVSVGEHLHGGLEEEGRVRQARHDIRQG